MKPLQNSEYALIIIIALIAAMIGLIIVKIVDVRLQGISINMPSVNLPAVIIKMSDGEPAVAMFENKQTAGASDFNTDQSSLTLSDPKKMQSRFKFDPKKYASLITPLKNTGVTPKDSIDHNSHPAPYPSVSKPIELNLRSRKNGTVTYYLNPKQMTPAQTEQFKLKAKFENMTIKDYENWLNLFKGTPQQLSGFHRANLKILNRNGKLIKADLPSRTALPSKSGHEYTKIISQGTLENIPQPEYLGYMPYNIDQEINLKGLKRDNRDLRHLDFINPDEPMKTWILTREQSKSKIASQTEKV